MYRTLRLVTIAAIFCAPTLALAAATASPGPAYPSETVGVDTPVTFDMILSGFTNPSFWLVDSFPGEVNNSNMNSQGHFYWVPNKDDIGTHTINITVSDAQGGSVATAKTITVVAPSVTASAPSPSGTVMFGTPVSFTLSSVGFTRPVYDMGDSFRSSSVNSFNLTSDGHFSWTPVAQDLGTHTFTITARDNLNFASTTQTIKVEGLPSVSVIKLLPGTSFGVGDTLGFIATTTGFSSPTVTVHDEFYDNSPATSSLTLDSQGNARWKPVYNDIGGHTLVISATDSAGHSASMRLSLSVGVNRVTTDAPTPVPAPANAAPVSTPSSTARARFNFVSFLSIGSRGAEVSALQTKLASLGFLKVAATGYFGPATKLAVQAFQKSVGLSSVGYVGPGTRAALNK